MTPKDVIKNTIDMSHMVLTAYLSDLSDADLMVRPVPQAKHIAWQLSHLIASEHKMLTDAGLAMPDLPDGLAESCTEEAAKSDDAGKFNKKEQYLAWLEQQRTATLAALAASSDTDLDKPTPESMHEYARTVGIAFNMIGIHELMHAAQFVPIRRKLGKPTLI
ncbi:MAG: DinB family protein [Phycisphaerae bacterium]